MMKVKRGLFIFSFYLIAFFSFAQTDSLKASKKWATWLPAFNFKDGDKILSLGCGSAWREFELSLLTNRLNFYLEDIDSAALNQKNISAAKARFKRRSPLTNTFTILYGTSKALPSENNFADKVIIMNAWHHFTDKEIMLQEIHRTLKPSGNLIISDHISLTVSKESGYGCDHVYFLQNEKDLTDLVLKAGFTLVSVLKLDKRTRLFVFQRN